MLLIFINNEEQIASYTCDAVPNNGEVVTIYHNNPGCKNYQKVEEYKVYEREWIFNQSVKITPIVKITVV